MKWPDVLEEFAERGRKGSGVSSGDDGDCQRSGGSSKHACRVGKSKAAFPGGTEKAAELLHTEARCEGRLEPKHPGEEHVHEGGTRFLS